MSPHTEQKIVDDLDSLKHGMKSQDAILARLDYTINGNGKPGLKTVVDQHERSLKLIRRVAWVVLTPVLASLGAGLVTAAVYLARQTKEPTHEISIPAPVPGPRTDAGPGDSGLFALHGDPHPVEPSAH